MGSKIVQIGNCFALINDESSFSCDFSNSIVCKGTHKGLGTKVRKVIRVRPFQIYEIISKEEINARDEMIDKTASLMILTKESWERIIWKNSSGTTGENCTIKELELKDLEFFADIVFNAFGYDDKNREQSIRFY